MQTQERATEHELGNLLRYWRHQRGKSQLDLSLDTGISQRHLSFVESGRSVPSRDLLLIVSVLRAGLHRALPGSSGDGSGHERNRQRVEAAGAAPGAGFGPLLECDPHE